MQIDRSHALTAIQTLQSLRAAVLVFNEDKLAVNDGTSPVPSNPQNRAVSWTALRYLLGEVSLEIRYTDTLHFAALLHVPGTISREEQNA